MDTFQTEDKLFRGTKLCPQFGKKLRFGLVVKVKVRVTLQEMSVSLCYVPKSDPSKHVCV